jgi:N-acetylneuraminic acid mutarotase
MKRIIFLVISIVLVFHSFSQINNGFKYQAVARDSFGNEIKQHAIALQLSILEGSVTGIIVYKETHNTTTNKFGLFGVTIGKGTPLSGNFNTINWPSGLYFLKTEVDVTGGTNFKLMGVSQLLDVPFAKYAEISGKAINDLDISPTNEFQTLALTQDTLSISNGNSLFMPRFIPENTCLLSLYITPPFGYTYSGDDISTNTSWQTKASMPTPRMDAASAVVNNKIYIIGGWTGTTTISLVEEYDPSTNTWATKTSMPTIRLSMGCGVVNNKIYVFGGGNGSTYYSKVEEYDPATDTWTTKSNMPISRVELSCAVVNNKIYVIGGYNSTIGALNITEEYTPATDSWSTKANMPTARWTQNSIACNNKIYVIGGYNGSSYLTLNEEFNPMTNTWTQKASMTVARADISIGVLKEKIYVIGGGNSTSRVNTNEEYDPVTNTWKTKLGMPTVRSSLGYGVANNKFYLIGGGISNTNIYGINEVYTPESIYYIHCKTKN